MESPTAALLRNITHPSTHLPSVFYSTPPITVYVCCVSTQWYGIGCGIGVCFVLELSFAWVDEWLLTGPSVASHPFADLIKSAEHEHSFTIKTTTTLVPPLLIPPSNLFPCSCISKPNKSLYIKKK